MDLTDYVATPISAIKTRFDAAKNNPTMLVKAELDTVEEITNGKAMLVDASNPAVMIMEMAAVLSANCVQETVVALRKQYSVLADTEDEIYLHMCDDDYINRFATPAKDKFILAILYQDLIREMVEDENEGCFKAIIPRDTTITVDGVTFSILYPIEIRRYNNGSFQFSYNGEVVNPIYALENAIISPDIRKGSEEESWIFLEVMGVQVNIATQYAIIDKTYLFQKEYTFIDSFCYARVFFRNAATWNEIAVTHTDQVYDPFIPTAVLTVKKGVLTVSVPVIYLTSGLISGEIRVDIYTTRGELSMNLKNYREDAFVIAMTAIDEVADLNAYTDAMSNVSFRAYSNAVVTGGRSALTFEALRKKEIYNTVGPQQEPITNISIESAADNLGFEIVKNVDLLTNRIFLATRKLPKPSNEKLITAANIGMITFATTLEELGVYASVRDNGDRITILSKAVWSSENGQLSLLRQSDLDYLYALPQVTMVNQVNAGKYFYTPFYYVLDASGDEFELRAYSLDLPYGTGLNFIRQNQTLQLAVNTESNGGYSIEKTPTGYTLRIITKSGTNYKTIADAEVGIQLSFNPSGESTYAYINGELETKTAAGERVYKFVLETNHDINANGLLCITNSHVKGVTDYKAWVSLDLEINLLHFTTSVTQSYAADETDNLIGKFILPLNASGNSHEKLKLHLGDDLSKLWRRTRSFSKDVVYRHYTEDVPARYTNDVYQQDPTTGSIFTLVDGEMVYTIQHHAGDPIFDLDGNPVYQHKAGDILYDEQKNPVYDLTSAIGREMDLFVVDGRYFFANDAATIEYRSEIENTLVSWIVDDVAELQGKLLEQTKIFFYPKTTLGTISVYTENGGEDYLSAEQSFKVQLYVSESIYNDLEIREKLSSKTVTLLDEYVGQTTVNMTEIFDQLRSIYDTSVRAFTLTGLGGDKNYQMVRVSSGRNKLCLKKRLTIQTDKTTLVEDAVEIEFNKSA